MMIDLLSLQGPTTDGSLPAQSNTEHNSTVSGPSFNEYLDKNSESESSVPERGVKDSELKSREKAPEKNIMKTAPGSENIEAGKNKLEKGDESGRRNVKKTFRHNGSVINSRKISDVPGESPSVIEPDKIPEQSLLEKKEPVSEKSNSFPEKTSVSQGTEREKAEIKADVSKNNFAFGEDVTTVTGSGVIEPAKGEKLLSTISARGEKSAEPVEEGIYQAGKKVITEGTGGKSIHPASQIQIKLIDQRSKSSKGKTEVKAGVINSGKSSVSAEMKNEGLKFSVQPDEGGDEVPFRVLELGPDRGDRENIKTLSVDNKALSGNFNNLLRDKGVPQIVKQTGILLKDNNQGEIKLVLRPDSLGKVRIRLNLQENNIAGRIIVENINVKDAFDGNLENLQKALRDSGFDTASLEVFVEGQGAGNHGDAEERPVFVHPSVIETIEDKIPLAEYIDDDQALVNLLA